MAAASFSVVLRERVGVEAYEALEELIQVRQANLLTIDRFERRLAEAVTDLRVELSDQMSTLKSDLRGDMQQLRADVRVDIADLRAELLKWAMVFWVAQAGAVAGIVSALR